MSNATRHRLLAAAAGCLLLLTPRLTAADGLDGNLVTVSWLNAHLEDSDVLVLDASPGQIYAAKHIPGAINVDFLTYGFPEKPIAEMERRYQSWGISPGKKIVAYDQGGTFFATRLFFSLYHHGFPPANLFVLDGGLSKWEAQGLPVTKDVRPAPAKGSFKITNINEDVRVRLPEFLAASGDPANNVLLEALGPDWHFGETLAFGRAGHVPNAILLPSADFFNPDKTFKSADQIRKMVAYLGIRPEQQIHSHCGGGVSASVPFFALKSILKYPKVKLYVESQMGWLADERELPFWTYDAPSLLRDTNWLQSWGGQRMRMFAAAPVSIVDVRRAEAFAAGHVPFALNIPADVFRSHLTAPEKLAAILGPAGVDASHEAVVVSDAGLTRDSALAFVLLEQLGQKRVSILTDSMDGWSRRGFPLTKDATLVGPRKNSQDLSIPPTMYPANPRKGAIITDPNSTQGLYPKVFIASGEKVPVHTHGGKVVHVPYTTLLNPDGTPRAAKEIWSVLDKAGVPRYAELVCYSEDPGEAAANYFILRLMGYPDVKVLVI